MDPEPGQSPERAPVTIAVEELEALQAMAQQAQSMMNAQAQAQEAGFWRNQAQQQAGPPNIGSPAVNPPIPFIAGGDNPLMAQLAAMQAQMEQQQQQMAQMWASARAPGTEVQSLIAALPQMFMAAMEAKEASKAPRSVHIKPKDPHLYSGARAEDLSLWAMAVNTYLELQDIPAEREDLRVKAASQFLAPGSLAQQWFHKNGHTVVSWADLQFQLSERFVTTDHHDQACGSLLALASGDHRLGVQEYNAEFQRHLVTASSKPGWEMTDAWQVYMYRQGLKADKNGLEMKKAILQKRCTTLKDAMTTAVEVEGLLKKSGPSNRGLDGRFQSDSRPDDAMELGTAVLHRTQVQRPVLTPEEAAEKKRRQDANLCLNCGEDGHASGLCTAKPVGTGAAKYAVYRKALNAAISKDHLEGNGPPLRKSGGGRGGRGGGQLGRNNGRQ